MEERSFLPNCNDEDVLAINENTMLKASKFKHILDQIIKNSAFNTIRSELSSSYKIHCDPKRSLGDGVDCEILQLGAKGWQKGKLRFKVCVEFCPDEPEIEEIPNSNQSASPLDDIRQLIKENN